MSDLEELLNRADKLKISLSIINTTSKYGSRGEMILGKYIPKDGEILLNPCQSTESLGTTFAHELFHDWVTKENKYISRELEEYNAEKYGREMYSKYTSEINRYLQDRGLL